MRINQYIAQFTSLSRRSVDKAINESRVSVNNLPATIGQQIEPTDSVKLDGKPLGNQIDHQTILFNKPAGYIVSRNPQGGKSVYDLLPDDLHSLNPVGRLDKDSSGLLIFSSNGKFINELAHPSNKKIKKYSVMIDRPLMKDDQVAIQNGVKLEDGISKLALSGSNRAWKIKMEEGRNRQIRRTFESLGYRVLSLHRTNFGEYSIDDLNSGSWIFIKL